MKNIVILISYLLLSLTCFSFPKWHIINDASDEYEFLSENVTQFLDESDKLTIDEVKTREFKFVKGPFTNTKLNSSYWLKFPLVSKSTKDKKWICEVIDAHQEMVEFYFFRDGKLIKKANTGQLVKDKNSLYSHKNHILDVPIENNDSLMVYVRYRSNIQGTMIFKIRTNGNFSSYGFKEYYFLGLYYGILILICLLNLVLFFFLKEKIYLVYILYVFAWMLSSLNDDGLGRHLVWNGSEWVDTLVFYFAQPVLITSYVFYSLSFFNRRDEGDMKYDKFIIGFTIIYLVAHFIEVFTGFNSGITTWLMFIPLIKILYYAFKTFNQGYSPSQFFILGNIFILLGLVIRFLQDQYIIKFVSYYTVPAIMVVYARNIGMILEIITLTIALGDRFRFIKKKNEEHRLSLMTQYQEKEKLQEEVIKHLKENEVLSEKVNHELETKVNERTIELQLKKDELETVNAQLLEQSDKINEMNRLLDMDNYKLKKEVKKVNSNRVSFKEVSFEEFKKIYPDKLSVLRFLNDHKWKDGYKCRKCGNTKFCEGNSKFSRRCTRCRYDESITAFTIFHKCKFSLEQAFYIVSKTIRQGKNLETQALSEELSLRKNTVWNFKSKVLKTIEYNKKHKGTENLLIIVTLNPFKE